MSRSRITMNGVEIRSQEYCVLGWVCQNDVMLNNLLPVGLLVTIIEPRDFMTDSLNITYMLGKVPKTSRGRGQCQIWGRGGTDLTQ